MMEITARSFWTTRVEPYIFFDRRCGILKVLMTRVSGFSPYDQRNMYLCANCPQHSSVDVLSPVYHRLDDMKSALRWFAVAKMKQLKTAVSNAQLFNITKHAFA